METTTIVIAGQELLGAVDKDGNYYIVVPELEKALTWRANSAREKLASKSLESFAGKALTLGKKKAPHGGMYSVISVKDLSVLLTWAALEGNENARNLLTATFAESLERRIDAGLGIANDEQKYEDNTREFYRELARKNFRPMLTDSMNGSFHSGQWGKEINLFKSALGLPQVNIDEYTHEQIECWSNGIVTYNSYRECGLTHRNSLLKLKSKLANKH